jgi:hypothetical protein
MKNKIQLSVQSVTKNLEEKTYFLLLLLTSYFFYFIKVQSPNVRRKPFFLLLRRCSFSGEGDKKQDLLGQVSRVQKRE